MSRALRLIVVAFLIVTSFMVFPVSAFVLPDNCEILPSGASSLWLVCAPNLVGTWNGDVVVYAHGYVAPDQALTAGFNELILPDGSFLPTLMTGLGYYFAASSYPKNGLAVKEGLADTRKLAQELKTQLKPNHVYLIGASDGGLVTTLAVERYPSEFSGGLALCGPVGNFRRQINYVGDFRVVFDYFFPELLPPSPVAIPEPLMETWNSYYAPAIAQALALYPNTTAQLLKVTQAATDPANPSSALLTTQGVLWYNVFATNEAIVELGGQPFSNRGRRYRGSDDDRMLNRTVQRFRADGVILDSINTYYQTSGYLTNPLVTLHTTADPVVPYWHETLYSAKVLATGSDSLYNHIPISRYGHCNFTTSELLGSFAALVDAVP